MRSFVLLAVWCSTLACNSEASAVRRATERAEPYLAEFSRFDRWARRAGQNELVLDDRSALSEALFAPIRGQSSVLAAFVQFEGDRSFQLSQPPKLELPQLAWIVVRDAALGNVRVALPDDCSLVLPRKAGLAGAAQCVFVQRRASAPKLAAITVTMAFP